MNAKLFILAIGCSGTLASAQSVPLWQKLAAGMSKSQVEALYPDKQIALTAQCIFKIVPRFENDALKAVWLRSGDKVYSSRQAWNNDTSCREIIRASIVEKYGAPQRVDVNDRTINVLDEYTWASGNVIIQFSASRRTPLTVISYTFAPSVAPPKSDAGAASKL